MRYSKSTRYALYAAIEMAVADGPVTVAQVSKRFRIPGTALAKVMQTLVRAGIARGVRGVGGGYVLSRPPAELTTLDVIAVFDPPRREGQCLLEDGAPALPRLVPHALGRSERFGRHADRDLAAPRHLGLLRVV